MNADALLAHYERVAEAPDAIAGLRRFILNLAVRGKLVSQDSRDERSHALSTTRSSKPNRGSKPSHEAAALHSVESPYVLPLSWSWMALGCVAEYGQADKVDSNGAITSDTWVLDLEDIEKDTSRLIQRVLSSERPFQSSKTIFQKGDVLFGKLRPYLNKVLVADADGVCTTEIVPVRGIGMTYPGYLALVLRSPLTMERIERLMYGMKMPRLGTSDAAALPVPIPPLAEQHRIVAKVDELMALCDRLEAARTQREATRDRLTASTLARLNTPEPPESPDGDASKESSFQSDARFALKVLPALTTRPDQIKQLRQTFFDLAVSGRLVAQKSDEEPFRDFLSRTQHDQNRRDAAPVRDVPAAFQSLPRSWQWTHLGDLVLTMDAGWSPQCDGEPRGSEAEWGVLKTTAVQALAYEPHQNKRLPEKLQPRPQHEAKIGDILVTRAGPKNRVGVSCVVDKPSPRLMISDKLIRFHTLDGIFPRYIALALNAGFTMECVERAKSGMAVMQMNISQDKLKLIPLPMPPLAEQHRIVAKVDELMSLCDQLEASLTHGQNTRSRLLNALLHEALAPAEPALDAA
ncbi:MAG: restriction endonuclease subunit S [Panacagrimonas sp.]